MKKSYFHIVIQFVTSPVALLELLKAQARVKDGGWAWGRQPHPTEKKFPKKNANQIIQSVLTTNSDLPKKYSFMLLHSSTWVIGILMCIFCSSIYVLLLLINRPQ